MKRLLFLLLVALPLAANQPITVIPPGPTTLTPVTLRLDVWCNPITGHKFLAAAGTTIRIELTSQQGTCPSPPFALPYDVDLGLLPSGEIHVEVYVNNSVYKQTFVVRNAVASVGDVEIHPFAVPTQPNALKLRLSGPVTCAGENCAGVQVTVGGVNIPSSQLRGAQPACSSASLYPTGLKAPQIVHSSKNGM